jgi:glycosyltransferase involved in cell wall biosynthesis
MQLAIIHYHLNRGGVTQVILNHLRCLRALNFRCDTIVVLYGGRKTGWPDNACKELDVRLIEVPSLEYDELSGASMDLTADVLAALTEAQLKSDQTVVQIHNHSLGKNAEMPRVAADLAVHGYRVLLQIHDFAEDLRPDNYAHLRKQLGTRLQEELYPQSESIHYATLNSRDREILLNAGVPNDRLHWLPNPVYTPDLPADPIAVRGKMAASQLVPRDHRFLLYPVRAIARKNVGEALLWALLSDRQTIGITMAPVAAREQKLYQNWIDLAQRFGIRCRFDLSSQFTFGENVAASDGFLTTSVAEGFGMVFLESYLTGRETWGRDLPEITTDFRKAGIMFPRLRPMMAIPRAWIDMSDYRQSMLSCYRALCRQFDFDASTASRQPCHKMFEEDTVDFGRLPVALQEDLIGQLCRDRGKVAELSVADRDDHSRLAGPNDLSGNQAKVQQNFGEAAIGSRLMKIYRRLLASPAGRPISPAPSQATILQSFLSFDRLFPIRLVS